jgi:nucleotide-binding universal stress UspA family protein
MLPFRKILFPVDYSDPCVAMAPYVQEMRRHFSTGLAVAHAYGPETLAFSPLPITDPRLPQEARELAEKRLRDFTRKHFPGQEDIELYTGVGEPAGVIHDLVTRQGADLVMLPTHGRGPVRRLLLGSVTAKVLHDMTVPVWTASHLTGSTGPRIPCQTVLAAVNGSEEAETVVRAAHAFAASYGAKLSLVYVLETPPGDAETAFGLYRDDMIAAAQAHVAGILEQTGIDAPLTILDGPVAAAVGGEALRAGADLVVAGRGRAQGALTRMWSNLYSIVRHSPCPVLSI